MPPSRARAHPLPLATVVLVVLLAGMAGGAVPVPGNGGGVELALAGMLALHGVPLVAASGAVLVARLIGFWLPGLVGVAALVPLRRELRAGRPAVIALPAPAARPTPGALPPG